MWHGLWWIVRVIKARKTGHAPANNEESSVVLVWPNDGDIHIKRTLYYLHIHYITSHHITVHDMTLQCIPAHYNIQYIASILACCKDCKSNIYIFFWWNGALCYLVGVPFRTRQPPQNQGAVAPSAPMITCSGATWARLSGLTATVRNVSKTVRLIDTVYIYKCHWNK